MKFKGKVKVDRIDIPAVEAVGNGIELEYEVEYSLEEAKGFYALARQAVKELPEFLSELKTGHDKFSELNEEVYPTEVVSMNDIVEEVKRAMFESASTKKRMEDLGIKFGSIEKEQV